MDKKHLPVYLSGPISLFISFIAMIIAQYAESKTGIELWFGFLSIMTFMGGIAGIVAGILVYQDERLK